MPSLGVEPSASSMHRAAVDRRIPYFGTVALAILCAGCAGAPVVPGVTYSREFGVSDDITRLRVTPDSSALVFGIDRMWWRSPLGILAWPDGGMPHDENTDFELYRYDLARRTGPERVARWKRARPGDDHAVVSFDGRTAIVTTLLDDGSRQDWAVDVVRNRRRPLSAEEGGRLRAETRRLDDAQADAQSAFRAFFEENAGQFFQWAPERWEQDLLFELPLDRPHEAFPGWREEQRRRRARFALEHGMHHLRSARSRSDGDSLRLAFETFVPVPRSRPRVYRIELELHAHAPREHSKKTLELARAPLPLRGDRFTIGVPWSRIDSTFAWNRAGGRRPPLLGHLHVLPVPVPEDSLLSGLPQGVRMGMELRFVTNSGQERHDIR